MRETRRSLCEPCTPPSHNARVLQQGIPVVTHYVLGSQYVVEVACADFDAFKQLPKCIEFDGKRYCVTGWNSDDGMAYYKTGLPMAYAVDAA